MPIKKENVPSLVLLRLTDLIYMELEGQPISISKEMLLEYYEDLK